LDKASGIRFYQFHYLSLGDSLTFPLRVESTSIRLTISSNHSGSAESYPPFSSAYFAKPMFALLKLKLQFYPSALVYAIFQDHTLVCPSVDLKYAYVVFNQLSCLHETYTGRGVPSSTSLICYTVNEARISGTALRTTSNLPSNHSFDTRSTNA
jgi:hypothetical protein